MFEIFLTEAQITEAFETINYECEPTPQDEDQEEMDWTMWKKYRE